MNNVGVFANNNLACQPYPERLISTVMVFEWAVFALFLVLEASLVMFKQLHCFRPGFPSI